MELRFHSLSAIIALGALVLACAPPAPPPPPPAPPSNMALIPEGRFLMGDPSRGDDGPPHEVGVRAFYLDKTEVTNEQFARFVADAGWRVEGEWARYAGTGRESHPAVAVTWNDAAAYARWMKKRLPTEAEWEYAARAARPDARYGVGGDGRTLTEKANFGTVKVHPKRMPLGGLHTTPVAAYEPTPWGIYDLAGNAAEWCQDWHDPSFYAVSPPENPVGPGFGRGRAVRGGSWNDRAESLTLTRRLGLPPGTIAFVLGFRCAADLPAPPPKQSWLARLFASPSSPPGGLERP
jgi:formylglycine-generating enzyme required for sulfatase activity